MKGTDNYDDEFSECFDTVSGVRQGCVLAPTLFSMQKYAFENCKGVYIHNRNGGGLFNQVRVRANHETQLVLLREILFADDTAFVSHTEHCLQKLISRFSLACGHFGLTTSIKKTEKMSVNAELPPSIIHNEQLAVADLKLLYAPRT